MTGTVCPIQGCSTQSSPEMLLYVSVALKVCCDLSNMHYDTGKCPTKEVGITG